MRPDGAHVAISIIHVEEPPPVFRHSSESLTHQGRLEMSMKKSILLGAIAISVLALGSARAQDVRYNFDKNTDFSKFKSYKWVELKGATPLNEITDKNVKAA